MEIFEILSHGFDPNYKTGIPSILITVAVYKNLSYDFVLFPNKQDSINHKPRQTKVIYRQPSQTEWGVFLGVGRI
jgi:hypothetical protein